jgi:hypothetical protein
LGVVFYEMLTGELPLGRFEPPSKKVRIDVRLDEVVLRSLESAPDRRYQHASDIKTDVDSIVTASDTRLSAAQTDTANFKSWVRSRLKVPAIGLFVAGIVNLLATLLIIIIPAIGRDSLAVGGKHADVSLSILVIVIALCTLVPGIILVIGAARMFDLQSYRIALFAAVVAILPCALGFPISLPFGIWALLVLSRRDVRTAFAGQSESEREHSAAGRTMVVGLAVGLALGALDKDNIGFYMILGMVLGLLIGWGIDNRRKSKG